MLLCIVCGKVIADVDPSKIRYGGCGKCNIREVAKRMEDLTREEQDEDKEERA